MDNHPSHVLSICYKIIERIELKKKGRGTLLYVAVIFYSLSLVTPFVAWLIINALFDDPCVSYKELLRDSITVPFEGMVIGFILATIFLYALHFYI